MNRVRFFAKITMVASFFAALTFTSCSDDDKGADDSSAKWCVIGVGEGQRCAQIGAKYKPDIDPNQQEMTEAICNSMGAANAQIKDEKPSDCTVITQ